MGSLRESGIPLRITNILLDAGGRVLSLPICLGSSLSPMGVYMGSKSRGMGQDARIVIWYKLQSVMFRTTSAGLGS
jgi:hypothetical protein